MRKFIWMAVLLFSMAALAACSEERKKEPEKPKNIQPLEAVLEVPEKAAVDESTTMKAAVSQGAEKVADAESVKFEVWEDGKKEDSKMIESTNNNDGTYEAQTTFDRDGVFTVQVHVDARNMHTMPLKTITVGKGAAAPEEGHHEHEEQTEHKHGEQAKHKHGQGFSMHFAKPETVKAGASMPLTVRLQMNNAPLEKAQVRYEIWTSDNTDKHDWVDAKETKPGEYSGAHTFTAAGTFTVQVHVENKDGLHEHEEHQLTVTNE